MDKNDHRRLARQLDLYHFDESAPGMVFWHPRGYALYRKLEDLIRRKMRRLDYLEVRSPQLLPVSFWKKSGHWDKFRDHMFVLSGEDEDSGVALKPMSCPCHVAIFNDSLKSWRDLPARYAEFGQCHRDEPSGALHGLLRTRAFEQDDAHVLCAPEQMPGEVARIFALIIDLYKELGFDKFEVALSTRPEQRAGKDSDWDQAEASLEKIAIEQGFSPKVLPGEGAFYGPKLEFSLCDRHGRSWQCGTIQLDTVLPERLGAKYVDQNGQKAIPLMIHHALLGSIGRFIGILLEHHDGKLPFALAPNQVAILPISQNQLEAAEAFRVLLRDAGVDASVYGGSETLSRRIVEVRKHLYPAQVVIGAREIERGSVSLRMEGEQRELDVHSAVEALSRRND